MGPIITSTVISQERKEAIAGPFSEVNCNG
jgi:hypothetical protein